MRKLFLLLVLLSQNLFAQKEITYKNLTDGTFRERSVNSVNWMNDGRYYSALAGNQVIKFDIKSGEAIRVLADGNALGITIDDYAFSADEKQMLLLT
ncbi:MAG: S9 family peptidase, partial [Cyclobacteriaceae bacterium]|nr:S9 family peptidase [Cyclobacteriaceae bacterium HetDA_MAG_MS6]